MTQKNNTNTVQTYIQTYIHTPEEGRNDAGVNEWEERWEAVPLPLAIAFLLCCKCFHHPETHGHRTADVTQHKASSQLHRKKWLLDKNHFLKWRGYAKAEVNYSDGVNTTKTNCRYKYKYRECVTSFQTCPISLSSLYMW